MPAFNHSLLFSFKAAVDMDKKCEIFDILSFISFKKIFCYNIYNKTYAKCQYLSDDTNKKGLAPFLRDLRSMKVSAEQLKKT